MRVALKSVMVAAALTILGSGSGSAGTVTWGNTDVWADDSGTPIEQAQNWVVAVYSSAYDPGAGLSPVATGQGTAWYGGGGFATTFDTAGGFSAYSVIFNNTSIGSATLYTAVDPGGTAIPSIPGGSDTFQYNLGAAGGVGNWSAVPEPGTMALFGLGVMAMAVRKRFKK